MIKTLIVDDEMLVRKGLVMTIPWSEFGIEIIGEASCGSKALEFIKDHEVDLLITDITMPNMSGFELMDEVMNLYPYIFIVVLTCHQDFDYIQRSLRNGAIDYIVKTDLEEKEIENSLKRIVERINSERAASKNRITDSYNSAENFNSGVLLVARKNTYDNTLVNCLNWQEQGKRIDISSGVVLYRVNAKKIELLKENFLKEDLMKEWVFVNIKNIGYDDESRLCSYILRYLDYGLFYEYNHETRLYQTDAAGNECNTEGFDNEEFFTLKKAWSSVMCMLNNHEFNKLKIRTKEIKPDISRLKSMFYKAITEWESSLCTSFPEVWMDKLEAARFWVDYDKWLEEIKSEFNSKINQTSYPDETVEIIWRSLEYVKQSAERDINQEMVAGKFNLSRSYFSKAFGDIVGMSFTEYMKNIRIEKAKSMLVQSNIPIYMIADEVGFLDDKYFSRMFKKTVGMTPVEYRNIKKH